jgi:hypothetical protein
LVQGLCESVKDKRADKAAFGANVNTPNKAFVHLKESMQDLISPWPLSSVLTQVEFCSRPHLAAAPICSSVLTSRPRTLAKRNFNSNLISIPQQVNLKQWPRLRFQGFFTL